MKSTEQLCLFYGKQKKTISARESREGCELKVHFSTSNYILSPHMHNKRSNEKLKIMKIGGKKLSLFLKSSNSRVWVLTFKLRSLSLAPLLFCFEMHILRQCPEDKPSKVLFGQFWFWGMRGTKGSRSKWSPSEKYSYISAVCPKRF